MTTERQTHVINAAGRPLGRLAVEVANLLRGKQKAEFVPYKDVGDFVTVQNFKNVRVTGRKAEQKRYFRHSGYIGNLKEETLGKLLEAKPQEVLRKTVLGMLPHNKLRAGQIKRLKVEL
ncbi:MAG: 50S ribosomal protein L13 [bacterium]|nr:50S ribosomal protein L13 [bacterium]